MTDTRDGLIQLLANERGVDASSISATDRLLEDLGMDGDDAVEFFASYGARFAVDLTSLYEHWPQHFGPEGFGPTWIGPPLIGVLVCLGLLKFGIPSPWPYAVMGLGVAAAVWIAWNDRARRSRPHIPLRVQDLLDAASSRRWSVGYD